MVIIVMRGPAKIIIIICDWPPATMICYRKVIYNIGTEILMLTSNLHNSTLRGRTEMLVYDPESSDRDLSFGLGPRAVAAIFRILCFFMNFCRRRQNKLKLLHSKIDAYMMIRPFISMKSISSCVF